MMQVNQLVYTAGKRNILNNISFSLTPGKVTVILGPNGAGKSTLLRLLSGELKPSGGTVSWHNRPLHQIPPAQLATQRAVLTQQYAITLPFTCEEVVLMGRYPHFTNQPAADDIAAVKAAMEEMHVTHLSSRPFQTLSGGEQQRVQAARVLAQLWSKRPEAAPGKMLLLDEPTSSMDIQHQQLLLGKARKLAQQRYTVLIVLHDLNLAARYADEIVLLQKGSLLAAGTAAEVLQPATLQQAYGIPLQLIQSVDYPYPILVPGHH